MGGVILSPEESEGPVPFRAARVLYGSSGVSAPQDDTPGVAPTDLDATIPSGRNSFARRYDSLVAISFLRDPTPDDLPVLYEQQRDVEACAMAAFPSRDRDAFFAHWAKVLSDDSLIKKTITIDGSVAGHIGSFVQHGKREIGYWLGREYWGRGLATAAVTEFLAIVTERPLYAHVAAHNAPSIRVLEKCGFRRERVIADFATVGGSTIAGVVFVLE